MLVPTAITTVRLDSSRVTNVARRKPDADERRRLLCDAAIDLLAEGGAKNLSHLKVDRQARVADGTTSFYYRTAAALIRGVVDRVAELDAADFESLMGDQAEPDRSTPGSLLSRLAEAMLRSANNPELSRARARIELVLMCQRDPELRKQFEEGMAR